MSRLVRIVLFLAAVVLCLPRPAAAGPAAAEVAERLMEAMGGRDTWESKRYLLFRWIVERDGEPVADVYHAWDRWTGDYRVDGTTREGEPYRILFNVDTREGRAWKGGEELHGDDLAAFLEMGYGRFINDTYWLIMPWKWLDPGVNLSYEGQETLDGAVHDVVRLTFGDGVGLTSGDTYWGYVSRDTGLMTQWSYVLQDDEGNPGAGEPSVFRWEEWEDGGDGLLFSMRKTKVGEDPPLALVMRDVQARDEVPEGTFAPGAPAGD